MMKEEKKELSKSEKEILKLHALGKTPDEIAHMTFRSTDTVRTTIRNMKVKTGLSKAAELAAYYWCDFFGEDYKAMRKKMIAGVLSLVLFHISLTPNDQQMVRSSRSVGARSVRTRTRRDSDGDDKTYKL